MEKKYDVIALGELLIDFTMNGQSEQGNNMFEACPGGAPCNVLALLNKMGKKTAFLGKVGRDQFGTLLRDTITEAGIDASHLMIDDKVNTTLAFVHTFPDGDREFSFYRNPGADMMLTENEVDPAFIAQTKIFHFGTLSMTHDGVRAATKKAVQAAKDAGCLVSFDPNLRPPLWSSLDLAKELVSGLALTPVAGEAGDELEIKVTTGTNAEVSPKWTVTVAEAEDYFKEFRVTQILDKEHELFNIGADDKPNTLADVELAVSAVYEKDGIEVVVPLTIGDSTGEVSVSWGKYADTFDLRRTDKNAPTSVVLTLNAEDEDDDIVRTVSIGLKFTEDYATEVNVTYKDGADKLELTAGSLITPNMFDYYAKVWASGKDVKDADNGDAITDSSLFEVTPGRVPYGTPAGQTVTVSFKYEANSEVDFTVGYANTVTVKAE